MVKKKHTFQFDDVYALAMSYGWTEKYAQELAELASNISEGKRVVIKHKNQWNPKFIKELAATK
ncbi:hypothetical protein V4T56_004335 [Vibrio vulnificus]|nr:hypothetical protein [Vibrio vulnificus]EGR7969334.1 hypothetical protein [Vibrio vulnificus]EIV8493007.1 hypothetical protein [Vibrio vulnificus]EIY9463282.1 hypothetical protein [Vibrio vulnificus]EIZ1354524.1 hypothetical protein [Vibrio vulnificus]EJB0234648.1 hypothetical protein [Vibrio vulnificus]